VYTIVLFPRAAREDSPIDRNRIKDQSCLNHRGPLVILDPVSEGGTQVFARRLVLMILACQVSFAVPAWGQNSRRSGVSGRNSEMIVYVRAPTGEPLDVPAIVQLFKWDGTPHDRTTAQGISPVVFSNLGPGGYYVEVQAPGFQTTRQEATVVVPVTTDVHVYMRPQASAARSTSPAGPPLLVAPKAQREVEQGLEALRANNLKEAQKRLDHAAELAPGHPDVFYLLGVLYVRLNDLTRARGALEKATQLDPNHPRALAALGTVLSNQGEYAAAIPILEKAVAVNDRAWETQWTLASAEYQQRRFEQARAHAQQALATAQGRAPEIQLLIAQVLAALGQREKAAQELESFLRSHPEHAKAPLARGWLARLQQNR
jgi:Flp pilus assembly protein TadD